VTPVFVYGSLMEGEKNDGLLTVFKHQPASCLGALYMMPAGYPALVPSKDGRSIKGELIHLPEFRMLRVLDHFERVSQGLYLRQEIRADLGGTVIPAWAYVLTPELARRRRLRKLDVDDWRKLRAY
jgi:gamma-glutamylcyclotransferase (GGCT)/AIG2-like uncharacterized protein YtfP